MSSTRQNIVETILVNGNKGNKKRLNWAVPHSEPKSKQKTCPPWNLHTAAVYVASRNFSSKFQAKWALVTLEYGSVHKKCTFYWMYFNHSGRKNTIATIIWYKIIICCHKRPLFSAKLWVQRRFCLFWCWKKFESNLFIVWINTIQLFIDHENIRIVCWIS